MAFVRALALAVLVSACSGLRTHFGDDGGSGGGTSAGGGSAMGGGGAAGTGGGAGGAWSQRSTFSLMGAASSTVTGIAGTNGVFYAVTSFSGLYRMDGAAGFVPVSGLSLNPGRSVYVDGDSSVFVAAGNQLFVCHTGCDSASQYTVTTLGATDQAWAICGNLQGTVWAVVQQVGNNAALWQWEGTMWVLRVGNLGVNYPRACVVPNSQSVEVAGLRDVGFYVANAMSDEPAATSPPLSSPTEAAGQQWNAAAIVEGTLYVAGDKRRISKRVIPGSWSLVETSGSATDALFAIGGPSTADLFAAGDDSTGNNLLRLDQEGVWTYVPALPVIRHVASLHSEQDDIFFGGSDGNDNAVIVKMTR